MIVSSIKVLTSVSSLHSPFTCNKVRSNRLKLLTSTFVSPTTDSLWHICTAVFKCFRVFSVCFILGNLHSPCTVHLQLIQFRSQSNSKWLQLINISQQKNGYTLINFTDIKPNCEYGIVERISVTLIICDEYVTFKKVLIWTPQIYHEIWVHSALFLFHHEWIHSTWLIREYWNH